MAIEWGSYDGHLRVGIDVTISPANPSYSDTTVKVTWTFYADSDGWNFSDNNENYHYWGDGFDTTASFDNHITGSAVKVATHSQTYGISSNSGSKTANAHLSGVYNGASPTKARSINLPNRPAAPVKPPSAGEAPSASSITASSALISWAPPTDNGGEGVDQYRLQVDNNSSFATPKYDATFSGSGSDSRTATGLDPNTTYYARVVAHNSAGWGDWTLSTYCPFTTLGTAPSTPGTPTLSAKAQNSLTVSWKASTANGGGTVSYSLQYDTSSSFTSPTTLTPSGTSQKINSLATATTYFFRVRASNTGGTSSYTPTFAATTLAAGASGYTDDGDYVTLVNNLSSAVADKMLHLGIYTYRVHTNPVTAANGAYTTINMGGTVQSRGPDNPAYLGVGNGDMTIAYPGLYVIEFGFHWVMNPTPAAGHGLQVIYVNGTAAPSTTTQKTGIQEYIGLQNYDGSSPGLHVTRHFVHLDAGDTVGFGVYQNTGADQTTGTSEPVVAYSRLTMVGY